MRRILAYNWDKNFLTKAIFIGPLGFFSFFGDSKKYAAATLLNTSCKNLSKLLTHITCVTLTSFSAGLGLAIPFEDELTTPGAVFVALASILLMIGTFSKITVKLIDKCFGETALANLIPGYGSMSDSQRETVLKRLADDERTQAFLDDIDNPYQLHTALQGNEDAANAELRAAKIAIRHAALTEQGVDGGEATDSDNDEDAANLSPRSS